MQTVPGVVPPLGQAQGLPLAPGLMTPAFGTLPNETLMPQRKPRASKVSGARDSLCARSWHVLDCSYTVELRDRATPQPARTYQGRRRILRRRNPRGARGNRSRIPNRRRCNGTCTSSLHCPSEPPPYSRSRDGIYCSTSFIPKRRPRVTRRLLQGRKLAADGKARTSPRERRRTPWAGSCP